jgi:ATP-binding cassette subfamily C protein
MYFSLYGSEDFITIDSGTVIRVDKGTVLVYLFPVEDGRSGRKLLLTELKPGAAVPSFNYKDEEGIVWKFQLMSLDEEAGITVTEDDDPARHRAEFVKAANIPDVERIGYDEAVVEVYRLHQVKDDAFIYQVDKDGRLFYENGLKAILEHFEGDAGSIEVTSTGNDLYKAVDYICKKKGISIEDYESIIQAEGSDFLVEDIARMSDFLVRQVKLEGNWYKKDSGMLLGFIREGKRAVVLEPHGIRRYDLVDPVNGTRRTIKAETAKNLLNYAYVVYRPLPSEKVGIKQIALFMLKEFSYSDALRYLIMTLLGIGVGVLLTKLNKWIFDGFIPEKDWNGLFQVGGMLLSFTIGNILFGIVGNIAALRMTTNAKYNLQAAVYHRALNLPQTVLNSIDSADLAGRITGFSDICIMLASQISSAVMSFVSGIAFFFLMISYSKALTAGGIILLVIYIFLSWMITRKRSRYEKEFLEYDGKLRSELYQALMGIEKIRLSGSENNVLYRYIRHFLKVKGLGRLQRLCLIAMNSIDLVVSTMFTLIIICLVSFADIPLTTGDYMAFSSAFGSFAGAVTALAGLYSGIMGAIPEWDRFRFALDNEPESSQGKIRPEKISGRIDIDNLIFAYEKGEPNVLDGLSIHISPGEYVGVVGASGGGKSTLLKMLMGFLTPDKGKIYYDNMDLATLDKRELRKNMGVVLQSDSLISGSIADNLSIMAPGLKQKRMMEMLEKVGLKDDIEQMPMGLNTVLDAENPTISGGQKQRLIIARALAADPRIVLFDEATSALDNITQSMVCETLKNLEATRIVIAHRLSTVMHCDRILVLDKGKIAEEGTYEELMARNGIFARMAKRQIA